MTKHVFDRRSFLKFSMLAALALYDGRTVWAQEAVEELPIGELTLVNTHTDEKLSVIYRDSTGEYDMQALDAIHRLLRCHYTGEVKEIDLRTIEFLNLIQAKIGASREIHIISGYRSPEYNELLRRRSQRVARHSLHMEGRAVDIRIPRVPVKNIRQTAVALQYGGVGYYPRSGFVHLDSGQFRTW